MEVLGLKVGSHGQPVRKWQNFLRDLKIPLDQSSKALDRIFGQGTRQGTEVYQKSKQLAETGVVDAETYAVAVLDGFNESVET